jgi:hypothetical protein
VDTALTFLNQLFVVLGYVLMGTVAYKLFQLDTEVREVRALLEKSKRNALFSPAELGSAAPSAAAPTAVSLTDADDATEYAEKLLRSLQAESARSESETQKTL